MKFKYLGQMTAVTLIDGKTSTDVILHHGKEYDLPEKNRYVKTLQAKKLLLPVEEKKEKKNAG